MKTILEKLDAAQMEQLKAGTASVVSEANVVCSAGDGYALSCCNGKGKETGSTETPVQLNP